MKQTFEAIWSHGKIIPKESVNFKENTHLKITVLDDQAEVGNNWQRLRGKYKGKLSSVDEFIRNKEGNRYDTYYKKVFWLFCSIKL